MADSCNWWAVGGGVGRVGCWLFRWFGSVVVVKGCGVVVEVW